MDTLGNLLKVIVTVANRSDGKAAIELLKTLPQVLFKRLKRLWTDGGYRGEFVEWVAKKFKKIVLDITLRSNDLRLDVASRSVGSGTALSGKVESDTPVSDMYLKKTPARRKVTGDV